MRRTGENEARDAGESAAASAGTIDGVVRRPAAAASFPVSARANASSSLAVCESMSSRRRLSSRSASSRADAAAGGRPPVLDDTSVPRTPPRTPPNPFPSRAETETPPPAGRSPAARAREGGSAPALGIVEECNPLRVSATGPHGMAAPDAAIPAFSSIFSRRFSRSRSSTSDSRRAIPAVRRFMSSSMLRRMRSRAGGRGRDAAAASARGPHVCSRRLRSSTRADPPASRALRASAASSAFSASASAAAASTSSAARSKSDSNSARIVSSRVFSAQTSATCGRSAPAAEVSSRTFAASAAASRSISAMSPTPKGASPSRSTASARSTTSSHIAAASAVTARKSSKTARKPASPGSDPGAGDDAEDAAERAAATFTPQDGVGLSRGPAPGDAATHTGAKPLGIAPGLGGIAGRAASDVDATRAPGGVVGGGVPDTIKSRSCFCAEAMSSAPALTASRSWKPNFT